MFVYFVFVACFCLTEVFVFVYFVFVTCFCLTEVFCFGTCFSLTEVFFCVCVLCVCHLKTILLSRFAPGAAQNQERKIGRVKDDQVFLPLLLYFAFMSSFVFRPVVKRWCYRPDITES